MTGPILPLTLVSDVPSAPQGPRVEWVERPGSVLHSSALTGDGDVLALNLARGCAHRCAFCSVRAYPTYPGDGVVQLFAGTAERLERELSGRRRLPRAVFVSPSTDPFPPIRVVQNEAVRVVEVLARNGVEAWLMTRGALMVETLDALAVHAARVKVTVGVTTLDQRLQRVLEPLAALPRERVRQVAELQRLGVRVQVGVEPLLPGLTDTRENLEPLLAALAGAGVRHVTASYAFLRPGIAENLATTLDANGLDGTLPTAYERGPMLEGNGLSPARYLPKARRQRGYAALMALAANHGITVSVCGTTNPDFAPPRAPEGSAGRPSLLTQFLQASGALSTFV
jgi:DNA repair photolyase